MTFAWVSLFKLVFSCFLFFDASCFILKLFSCVSVALFPAFLQNYLELNALNTVERVADYRRSPAQTAPLTMCDSPVKHSGVFQIPGDYNCAGPEVGGEHHLHHQEGPAEDVLPGGVEEIQYAAESDRWVLHSHH